MKKNKVPSQAEQMLVTASPAGPFSVHRCKGVNGCGRSYLAASADSHCPYCGEPVESSGTPLTAEVQASVQEKAKKPQEFLCATCNRHIFVANTDKSVDDILSKVYCPTCGSADIGEVESQDAANGAKTDDAGGPITAEAHKESGNVTAIDPDAEAEPTDMEGGLTEGQTPYPPVETTAKPGTSCEGCGDDGMDDDTMDAMDANTEETEDDVRDALKDGVDELQIVSMSLSDGDEVLMACSKDADPLFRIRKSRLHANAQSIFGTSVFYDIFHQRVSDVGLFAAVKEFNGELYKPRRLATKTDMEAMAISHMQKSVMPKFMDCLATAIEGSTKGIFADTANQLKASIYDEIVARTGAPEDRIVAAIEAAFSSGGMPFFTSIVAKSMELMSKPEAGYSEIKAMVQGSTARSTTVTADSVIGFTSSEAEFRRRLDEGNVPISFTEPVARAHKTSSLASVAGQASINSLRQSLKLGSK
jgi:endogenous inhibitor of DNA gyrase (YacG/DUF329 family)